MDELTPTVEGSNILVKVPKVTKETREALVKKAGAKAEEAKIAIRRARQKGMDELKKLSKTMGKDELKMLEKEVQKLVEEYGGKIDQQRNQKCDDLRTA